MEHILRPIYQERAGDPNTLGAILVEKVDELSPTTDNFDSVLLLLVKEAELPIFTKHYTYNNRITAMHIITEAQLRKWLLLATNKKLVDWLYNGRVVFDRNEFVSTLRKELKDNPYYGRSIKMGIEFSKLLRRYQEGRVSFEQKNFFDAYHHMSESLLHLARLSIIEEGNYPELMVWNQVRYFNAEVYRLNEEFIMSSESIEQRLELVFLATEFMLNSKMEECSVHILRVMEEQTNWSIQQLHEQEELKNYSINLEVFIEYLVDKGYIDIERLETKTPNVYHRYYVVHG
ncbi:nucleotidyltransferase-like protein [Kurthia sibirica]|uniref:Nucleotidyltransferase-like domain-containing protein n=1 Tax=Kurthia sibirica TaxID=202750 RepID=A0A2U3ALA8_9BACL|nr:nucleotidyltransferase-like protein [Kurthia sibirica]PWI25310.1 hypothetical protein DEX24_09340 [Kurthia sibirica]GEK34626.1 hypothetical protein KSI01_21590 [Kurthia sibirica]